ncbi:fatty acid desaturase family protein [Tellurirhabdus bombi]|uniref:fatty acid desaturase family protein n=1 Tax=Tellurirhabdus bombi TaxID=2907205 RepID=UPI001F1C0962|nr:acyl-CoA desaturase [Tellurirhabdus bombi]
MISLFLVPYALILSNTCPLWLMTLLAFIMGIGISGIGMSVMHDANHGSFSAISWVNTLSSSSLYLLGGNVLNWRVQHNTLHHTYTNIHDMDEDITGKPLLRLSPSERPKQYHQYQHIYAFLLYGLMTFSFFVKDFRQAYRYSREKESKVVKPFTRMELTVLFLSKLFYLVFIAVLPIWLTDLTFVQWLIGFCIMHFTAGLILSIIFQMAHIVEGAEHAMPDEQGTVHNAWAIHQVRTTANFGCPVWVSWFIGGLDFQVEHHLFPNISHVHYRALSKIVRRTAEDFDIPYNAKSSLLDALRSHVNMLKELGNGNAYHEFAVQEAPVNQLS